MVLSVSRSLKGGFTRAVSRNGLLLALVSGVLGAVTLAAYNSMILRIVPDTSQDTVNTIGPALPVSLLAAGAISVLLYLASFVVVVAALRTFVTDETGTVPLEYVTRNVGWALVNYVIGYVVFVVALWIGFLLLVVPGLFLLVSLYLWFVVVAVEDENFVAAFRRSWALAKGDRWQLLGLGVVVMVIGTVLYGALFAAAAVGIPWLTLVVFVVVGGGFSMFSLATAARAYVQVAGTGEPSTAA